MIDELTTGEGEMEERLCGCGILQKWGATWAGTVEGVLKEVSVMAVGTSQAVDADAAAVWGMKMADNPGVPDDYPETLRKTMSAEYARTEIDGVVRPCPREVP